MILAIWILVPLLSCSAGGRLIGRRKGENLESVFHPHPQAWERKYQIEGGVARRNIFCWPECFLRGECSYLDYFELSKEKLHREAVYSWPKSIKTELSCSFEGMAAWDVLWLILETRSNVNLVDKIQHKLKNLKKKILGVWLGPWIFIIVSFVSVLLKMLTTKRNWEIYLHFDLHWML